MSPDQEIAMLRRINAELRTELDELVESHRQLIDAIDNDPLPSWLPPLTPHEAKVFRLLTTRGYVDARLYEIAVAREEIDNPSNALASLVKGLRKKLRPVGVVISSRWGQGYKITIPAGLSPDAPPKRATSFVQRSVRRRATPFAGDNHIDTANRALRRAIRIAGSQTDLARRLRVSQQTVSHWLNYFHRVPAEYAAEVERATGVPRRVLRPDLFTEAAASIASTPNTEQVA